MWTRSILAILLVSSVGELNNGIVMTYGSFDKCSLYVF